MAPEIIAAIISGIMSAVGVAANTGMTFATNKKNEELTNNANAMQVAEAEKSRAYSSPSAQVSRLQDAGMSKAGALSSLNGSGAYTPAPVNVAQYQAPQMDLSSFGNSMSTIVNSLESSRNASNEERKTDIEESKAKTFNELNKAQILKIQKEFDLTDSQVEWYKAQKNLTIKQIESEGAKYKLSLKQIEEIGSKMDLNAQEILNLKATAKLVYAQTDTEKEKKNLVKQQFLTEMHNTSLKDYEVDIAFQNYLKLTQEVSEFLSPESIRYRSDMTSIGDDLIKLEKELKISESTIKQHESTLKELEAHMKEKEVAIDDMFDNESISSYPVKYLKFVVSLLKGIVSVKF